MVSPCRAIVGSLFVFLGYLAHDFAMAREFATGAGNVSGSSTKRDLLDIEIEQTSHHPPGTRQVNDRLRLRLERAFVLNYLTDVKTGESGLSLVVDRLSGLPSSLFYATLEKGRSHQNFPDVPAIDRKDVQQRQVSLDLQSGRSDRSYAEFFAKTGNCKMKPVDGSVEEIELEAKVGTTPCSRSVYPDGRKWLGRFRDGSPVVIECVNFKTSRFCWTYFNYQRFSVKITFNFAYLQQWQDIVSFGEKFLTSKRVEQ